MPPSEQSLLQKVVQQMARSFYDELALISIPIDHYKVYNGEHFSYISANDFTNAEVVSFLLTTENSDRRVNFELEINGESEYDVKLYEDATPDTVGSQVSNPPIINRNRGDLTLSPLVITSPTLGGGSRGNLIENYHAGSGRSNGGPSESRAELILKSNAKYWVDITNATANNNYISWVFDWYSSE